MYLILYVRVFCQHVCLCAISTPSARGDQRVLDPLEVGLWMGVVSHHVGTGNRT